MRIDSSRCHESEMVVSHLQTWTQRWYRRLGSAKEIAMHTRLFFGEIQQGKYDEAWAILSDFAQRVKQQKGCILQQVLRHGNEIVGITTWVNQEDLAA